YEYVLVEGLDGAETSFVWDSQSAGVPAGTVAIKINSGDDYGHTTSEFFSVGAIDPATDDIKPDPIDDLTVLARGKAGTAIMSWTAPGDDYANNGRADYYDIRYSTSPINNDTDFNNITTIRGLTSGQATGEPSPAFGGRHQQFEVTGLEPLTTYYFAIKTVDEQPNTSLLSSAKSPGSDSEIGGPRCGMCHTIAPSIVESEGNHKLHGITLYDCDMCHTEGAAKPSEFTLDHQDGRLVMGYGDGGAHEAIIASPRIYYTDNGLTNSAVLYDDTDGWGGFGVPLDQYNKLVGDGEDDGSCGSFTTRAAGACHGAAGSDPVGAHLPPIAAPTWTELSTLACAACHGNAARTVDSFYQRDFDGTNANVGVVPEQILGSPEVDNHGNVDDPGAPIAQRKYVGQHEKHLNYSFRFSKGDNCNLCHEGEYKNKADLSGKHGNGENDVELDLNAAGPDAEWQWGGYPTLPADPNLAGTCLNMSPDSCHPGAPAPVPAWDSAQTFECNECHGMGGQNPPHVTDPAAGVVANSVGLGNCKWCHFGGHPLDDVGGNSLILANNSQVGIMYASKGIHLKKSPGTNESGNADGTYQTEAELCWGCHDRNNISEWGTDTGSNNNSRTIAPNTSEPDFNYGYVNGSPTASAAWIVGGLGAPWESSEPNFSYKSARIQSTHSSNDGVGSSALDGGGSAYNYTESPDAVASIRCSNCHDVHDMNKAPGDDMNGQPYLRGTWVRSPYPEDGAPFNKTYTAHNQFGAVPRASLLANDAGGFQIDQNNGYPTTGLSLATSGGLCTLCHSSVMDTMDKEPGENLWMNAFPRNGHSNSALGGTATDSITSNIFGNGIGGRPANSGT
ncbi:MAG: hypothetical protein N2C12_07535, partial [Planctomycetales bacterium]